MKLDYLHLLPEQSVPALRVRPHRAILIAESTASKMWRDEVAAWMVGSGCLYFIAWGIACEEWHDAVDWAVLEAFDFGEIPDERFVMTSWHDKESLPEALWFAGNCASHPDADLTETLIVHVSPNERSADLLKLYHDSQETSCQT